MLRIVIVDDHTIIRQGLRRGLTDMTIVGEAGTAEDLFKLLPHLTADVLLLDLSLPDEHGVHVIPQVKALYPHLRIIIFSLFAETEYVRHALKAGASGYVLKTATLKDLNEAIRCVVAGYTYLSPPLNDIDLQMGNLYEKRLSPREEQVLQLIAAGKAMKEIAALLDVSPKTIAAYRARMLEKLQLNSTSALMHYAVSLRLGKLEPDSQF